MCVGTAVVQGLHRNTLFMDIKMYVMRAQHWGYRPTLEHLNSDIDTLVNLQTFPQIVSKDS